MKTLQYTTTGSLFNHTGILNEAGDYAGKFSEEALSILNKAGFEKEIFEDNEWSDIMHDNKGKCYAVFSTDALTCQNAECVYVEIDSNECESAFNEAQTHL